MSGERIQYFDFLRGLAIIMVIGIHTYATVPFDNFAHVWSINMRELINFAVPLFLAISGFFIGKKHIETPKQYLAFLKKQIPRVYVPLLLWSFPMVVLMIIYGQLWIASCIKGLLCATFGPYYFICLIIQFYILHPLFARMADIKLGGVIIVLLNIASLLLFSFILSHYEILFVLLVGPFIYWMSFYFIGVLYAKRKRNYSLLCPFAMLILGACMQLSSEYVLEIKDKFNDLSITLRTYFHSFSAWLYEVAAVILLLSQKAESLFNRFANKLSFLSRIGRVSFGVYLCHVYFLEVLNRFNIENWALRFIILSVVSIGFMWLLDAIIPEKYKSLFGIK